MTSIFYLLTEAQPVGHFHSNKSTIMHYFHMGDPIHYTLIHPCGRLEEVILGHDIASGKFMKTTKALELISAHV